jgi:AraC-like DNA-binding protein
MDLHSQCPKQASVTPTKRDCTDWDQEVTVALLLRRRPLDRSIADVAAETGFADQSHLTRQLLRAYNWPVNIAYNALKLLVGQYHALVSP